MVLNKDYESNFPVSSPLSSAIVFSMMLGNSFAIQQDLIGVELKQNTVEWAFCPNKKIRLSTESNRLEKRLNVLIEIYKNEEDVLPISDKAAENFRLFLANCSDDYFFKDWCLFSNDRGALSLEYVKDNGTSASICIAEKQISYFIEKLPYTRISGVEEFSVSALIDVIKVGVRYGKSS